MHCFVFLDRLNQDHVNMLNTLVITHFGSNSAEWEEDTVNKLGPLINFLSDSLIENLNTVSIFAVEIISLFYSKLIFGISSREVRLCFCITGYLL